MKELLQENSPSIFEEKTFNLSNEQAGNSSDIEKMDLTYECANDSMIVNYSSEIQEEFSYEDSQFHYRSEAVCEKEREEARGDMKEGTRSMSG